MTPHSLRIRSFGLQVLVLAYSLTAGAFHSNPPSVVNEPAGLARLGIAIAAGILGLVALNRHSLARQRSPNSLLLDVVVIYGLIILSQVALAFLNPALRLPNWAPTQGGFLGFMLFAATRALFAAPQANDKDRWAESGNEIEQERISQANRHRMVYRIASAIAVTLSGLGLVLTPWRGQIASALIMIGSIQLLRRTFGPTGIPVGSADKVLLAVLRSASGWYYLALLPASIVALLGSKVYLYWVPILILMFAEANQRAAASLERNGEGAPTVVPGSQQHFTVFDDPPGAGEFVGPFQDGLIC